MLNPSKLDCKKLFNRVAKSIEEVENIEKIYSKNSKVFRFGVY